MSIRGKTDRRSRKVRRIAGKLDAAGCAAQIVEGVRKGELKPAQRLGEVSLARKFGVGQAHIRAAFDRLAYAGILDRKSRSGTYVRKLSVGELIEMTQVRALLEGFACRQACRRATDRDLAELDMLAQTFDKQIDQLTPAEYDKLESIDLAFHQRIVQLSRNAVLKRILDDQHLILKCLRRGFDLPGAFTAHQSDAPNHAAIVQAMRSRDPDLAERHMRNHLTHCLIAELRLDDTLDFT